MHKFFKAAGQALAALLLLAGTAFFANAEPTVPTTEPTVCVTEPVTEPTVTEPTVTEPTISITEPTTIVSSYYQIQGNLIRGIAPGTTGSKLCKVCVPGGLSAPKEQLATGDRISYTPASGQTHTLTVIVTADLNGDAKVSITDLLMVKSCLLGEKLQTNASAAADVNYDGKVTITDFLRIKSNLLGLEKITAGRTAPAEDSLLLLMPGKSGTWTAKGAAKYISGNEALVSVNSSGKVTARSAEGSAFVYALDDQGHELDRVMVTVLNENLTVSLDQSALRLITGKSVKLNAQLNHPVTASISWSSSDTKIATVGADGTVKSVKPGVATITAQLANGSKAQAKVTVAAPITSIKTERTLYKVKPKNTKKISLILAPAGEEEVFTWKSSDPSVARVSDDGTVTGLKYGTVTITVTGRYSGLSASCKLKVCNVKQVALTFDDGPSDKTPELLDFLKENDIRVTFFLVGNRMNSYKSTVKREAAEGHEIGYHSYAHAQQTSLSSDQITSDFNKSNKILKDLTGQEFTLWRTPGGGYNDRVLQAVSLPHIMWSVDTLDWKHRNSSSVYNAILNNAKDGSIILMHDLYGSTVSGAIKAMKVMQEGDYEFVTVTELLSRDGTPPKDSTTYFKGP